ncbi:MAG: methyltransferase domain-containing protein [Planctomycetaceae bacterium]|nr:methyltransferase domain-containing protein [Planctomycetaceae bacterium]
MNNETNEHHESNQAFYDRISNAYDLIADSSEREARITGEKALELKAGERVLEIGFGTGNTLIDLLDIVGDSGQVTGIDVSTGMRDVAERKLKQHSLGDHVQLTVGDARQMPFEDESFDAVFTSFTLELFPEGDIEAVLSEVKRILVKNGRLGVVSMAEVKAGDHPSLLEKGYIWMHRHFPHLVDCRPIDPAAYVAQAGLRLAQQIDLKVWTMPVAVVVANKES